MVLGKLPVPGRPTDLDNSRQGPVAIAVVRAGVVLTFFFSIYYLFRTGRRPDID